MNFIINCNIYPSTGNGNHNWSVPTMGVAVGPFETEEQAIKAKNLLFQKYKDYKDLWEFIVTPLQQIPGITD